MRKVDTGQVIEMIRMYRNGATQRSIANKFNITIQTVRNYMKQANVMREWKGGKLLQSTSAETPVTESSEPTVPESGSPEIPFMSSSPFKPTPPPDPSRVPKGVSGIEDIQSENVEQTFRENLTWAIDAAGLKLRTGKSPTKCPNDSAFFLYQQAVENPKDFLTKFAQIEGRSGDSDEDKETSRVCKRAIFEIEEQLAALDSEEQSTSLDSKEEFIESQIKEKTNEETN